MGVCVYRNASNGASNGLVLTVNPNQETFLDDLHFRGVCRLLSGVQTADNGSGCWMVFFLPQTAGSLRG